MKDMFKEITGHDIENVISIDILTSGASFNGKNRKYLSYLYVSNQICSLFSSEIPEKYVDTIERQFKLERILK